MIPGRLRQLGPIGARSRSSQEVLANMQVNNMNQQQFEEHMNELFIRDNQKPIQTDLLSQLPRAQYTAPEGGQPALEEHERSCSICITEFADGE